MKDIKNNIKLFIGIGIGILISGGVVYASALLSSSDVAYSNSSSSVSNVKDALDELYRKAALACTYDVGHAWNFSYTNGTQKFQVPAGCDGTYQLEVWGASGGDASSTYTGGKGGYSKGTISLEQNIELYVVVGGQGASCEETTCNGGYNGGGASGARDGKIGAGGGATHIGKFDSTLSVHGDNSNLYIVAGGGGGSIDYSRYSSYAIGGAGGGLEGGIPSATSGRTHQIDSAGGTQSQGGSYGLYYNSSYGCISDSVSKGKFGLGGTYSTDCSEKTVAGGGGGYYGGGAGYLTGGAGGSSFIGGVNDGQTIDGNSSMPTHDGNSTMIGNTGNGYAKITYLGNN